MIRIGNISFFRFCWKNKKLDWPKCARTQDNSFFGVILTPQYLGSLLLLKKSSLNPFLELK